MGSGRKRPPERGEEKESKKKDGKSKEKKKKKKNKESNSESASSPLEITATAEGQIMAQVMSTFSRSEQSRFEAFRRATLPSDAISEYVAHCLQRDPRRRRPGAPPTTDLDELCAPGQAAEIAIVVSTLAKSYAQRLATAAKARAESGPIRPQHLLQALDERTAKGLDPGFFFVGDAGGVTSNVARRRRKDDTRRLAALQAQEEYDKWLEEQKLKKEKEEEEEEKAKAEEDAPNAEKVKSENNDNDEMELDFDSDSDDDEKGKAK